MEQDKVEQDKQVKQKTAFPAGDDLSKTAEENLDEAAWTELLQHSLLLNPDFEPAEDGKVENREVPGGKGTPAGNRAFPDVVQEQPGEAAGQQDSLFELALPLEETIPQTEISRVKKELSRYMAREIKSSSRAQSAGQQAFAAQKKPKQQEKQGRENKDEDNGPKQKEKASPDDWKGLFCLQLEKMGREDAKVQDFFQHDRTRKKTPVPKMSLLRDETLHIPLLDLGPVERKAGKRKAEAAWPEKSFQRGQKQKAWSGARKKQADSFGAAGSSAFQVRKQQQEKPLLMPAPGELLTRRNAGQGGRFKLEMKEGGLRGGSDFQGNCPGNKRAAQQRLALDPAGPVSRSKNML